MKLSPPVLCVQVSASDCDDAALLSPSLAKEKKRGKCMPIENVDEVNKKSYERFHLFRRMRAPVPTDVFQRHLEYRSGRRQHSQSISHLQNR